MSRYGWRPHIESALRLRLTDLFRHGALQPGRPSSAVRGVIFVFWRSVIVVVQGFARPRRGNAVVSRIVIEA